MKRIVLSLFAIIILISSGLFFGTQFIAQTDGDITIVLMDDDTEISRQNHAFKSGDTLYDILSANYEIYCANRQYQKDEACDPVTFTDITGRVLLGIDDLESNWTDTFIQIQINGTPATAGMDQLAFADQDVITLILKPVE
jgi:hypothetical protein